MDPRLQKTRQMFFELALYVRGLDYLMFLCAILDLTGNARKDLRVRIYAFEIFVIDLEVVLLQ